LTNKRADLAAQLARQEVLETRKNEI
jgi:hypothetical protein